MSTHIRLQVYLVQKSRKEKGMYTGQDMVLCWCVVMDTREQAHCEQECVRAFCRQHAYLFVPDMLLCEARLALESPDCDPNSSGAKLSAELTTCTEKQHLTAKRTPGTKLASGPLLHRQKGLGASNYKNTIVGTVYNMYNMKEE